MIVVFEYDDYVNFLSDWITSRPKKGRGIKTEMAHYMGCLPAHITKVLNRNVHLTLEQAAKVLPYLELSSLEGHYFLGLVELGRAGNKELREMVQERLEELKTKIQDPRRVGGHELEFSHKEKNIYYSSWHYHAVEILTSLPKFQTLEALSKCMGISKNDVMKVLNFLIEKGLIKRVEDKFVLSKLQLNYNVDPGITNIKNHHKNWRTRALISLDYKREYNINFTGVYSIPKVLVPVMRDFFIDKLMEFWNTIDEHPDDPDEPFCICLDFFDFSNQNE